MRAVIAVLLLASLMPLAGAQAPASVQRGKACVAATRNRHLTDQELKEFMRACLASKRPPEQLFENARTIERRCNTIANAHQLTGTRRIEFMQSCRRKGG